MKGVPGKRTHGGRIVPQSSQPKLCPTCLNPMSETATGWECAKHGPPRKP